MQKEKAINNALEYAGKTLIPWHVIKIGNEYYDVSDYYFLKHPNIKSVFCTGNKKVVQFRYKWYRMPIVWLNRFLKFILKRWLKKVSE